MKEKSILGRIARVSENLYRDPATKRYYAVKKIAGHKKLKALGDRQHPTRDEATAKRQLRKWLDKLEAGDKQAPDLKLDALIEKFLDGLPKGKRTYQNQASIAKHLRETFRLDRGGVRLPAAGVSVRQIRTSDLKTWLNCEPHARWSGSYFNTVRQLVGKLFELAIADGILDEATNPFKPKLIKARKRGRPIRRIPTLEQFGEIIADVRKQNGGSCAEESANFLEFLGLAGVGQAEAERLTWADVGPTHINFRRKKTGEFFDVRIYPWLRPLLARLQARRNGSADDGRVFKIKDAAKALRGACRRLDKVAQENGANFHRFTERNLRAMCVKRLHDAGIPAKQIALWQGHQDGGVLVQRIYTEVFCDDDKAREEAYLAMLEPGARKIVEFRAA